MNQSFWIVNIYSKNGTPFTLRVPHTTPFSIVEKETQKHTGFRDGHTMLFKDDMLVNRYPHISLFRVFPEHSKDEGTEVTLRLEEQEVIHPNWVRTEIPIIPLIWRYNNHYEGLHPHFLPEPLRKKAMTYFQAKSDNFRQTYEKTEQGVRYLKQHQPSLEVWGGLMV